MGAQALNSTSWGLEAIWQSVEPLLPGFSAEVLPEVDSTNSELMRRCRAGQLDPVLLVAERQSAGRGRMGRPWQAEPAQALTFSLGLPLAAADWSGLSLAVGLSLAESLHPDIRLKWPNDLWWSSCKLAGILIETADASGLSAQTPGARYVVVGVGINLGTPLGGDFSTPAVGLDALLPEASAPAVLARLFPALVQTLLRFERTGFAPWQSAFGQRDALQQRPVVLSDGTQGVAQGVSAQGALLVQTSQGVQAVVSSEVSVRPQSQGQVS
jgi:BirA family biotin operon repressor/biotin-[acetyl-CoA-carboxylase] ligase